MHDTAACPHSGVSRSAQVTPSRLRRISILLFLGAALVANSALAETPRLRILAISKTDGYRHQVIPTAIKTLAEMAQESKWAVTFTEDASLVTDAFLEHFDLMVLLLTTKDVFSREQESAVERFVQKGKGLLSIHTGCDTEYEWEWYGRQVGAKFVGHPPTQSARLVIEDASHPATQGLPAKEWVATDEWYSFDRNPRKEVHVLVSIDESTYAVDDNQWFPGVKQRMGDHPLVWYSQNEKGRVFQTALGHTEQMWADPKFRSHIKGAVEWTASKQ